MSARVPVALAVADFRARARRPAYVMVLAAAVGLGYLAVPEADGHWVIVNIGDYRGRYTSGYVGVLTALAGALWLSFAGFYVVRGAITRDERTGVGQLLAATPVRTVTYLFGKFLSNLLVLASMAAVLAGTAVLMQLARGEDRQLDPVALLMPFGLLTLPVLGVTAAAAVFFDTVRPLRGGFGNVFWFFAAMGAALVGQGPHAPLGGLGVHRVAESVHASLVDQGLRPERAEFGLGLMYLDRPLRTFEWSGLEVDVTFVGQRLLLLLLAALLGVLPTLWFGRFDPARAWGARTRPDAGSPASVPVAPAVPPGVAGALPGAAVPIGAGPFGVGSGGPGLVGAGLDGPGLLGAGPGGPAPDRLRPVLRRPSWLAAGAPGRPAAEAVVAPTVRRGAGLGRLVAGELRMMRRSGSRWWWLGAGLVAVAGLLAPIDAVATVVLPLAWVWPVLVWSRLGTHRYEHGVDGLLGAYPGPRRGPLAEWVAGVALTGVIGLVPVLRMALAQDWPGVGAWVGGLLLVPSLALAAGVVSRTHRLFQVIYLALWYATINGIAALDVMGAVRVDGRPVGPPPVLVVGLALALLVVALLVTAVRHARR